MTAHNSTSQESNLRTASSPALPSHEEVIRLIAVANRLRAEAISSALRGAFAPVGSVARRLLGALGRRRENARALRQLRQMDDRMLADIGLTRTEINHAVLFGLERGTDRAVHPLLQLRSDLPAAAVNDGGDDRQVA